MPGKTLGKGGGGESVSGREHFHSIGKVWVRLLAQPQSRGCFWETAGTKEEDAPQGRGGDLPWELLLKQPLSTHYQVLPTYVSGKIPNGRKETMNPEPEHSALRELSKHRLICKRNREQ